jgi:HJR/Mrr/RecB family endonuclease
MARKKKLKVRPRTFMPRFRYTALARRRRKSKQDDRVLPILIVVMPLLLVIISLFQSVNTQAGILLIVLFLFIPSTFAFFALRRSWTRAQELHALKLADVDMMPGHTFEHYIAQVMEHQGYKTNATKGSGDLGVDIVAQKDGVRYAVQCKRYGSNISRTAISDAVAGKQHYDCTHAMVVTNQYFTPGAVELATSTQCILIDRITLATWVTHFQKQTKSNLAAPPNTSDAE